MEAVVFDRTNTDVQLVKQYRDKIIRNGFDSLTQQEQALWLNGMKGAYNYTDFNRVGRCVNYLVDILNDLGYELTIEAKEDWTMADEPSNAQLTTFINNVAILRSVMPLFTGTPNTPNDFIAPTYVDANAVEQILYDLDIMIKAVEEQARRCGTFSCGESEVLD